MSGTSSQGLACLVGDALHPVLEVWFPVDAATPSGTPMLEWVRAVPDRRWDPAAGVWRLSGLGRHPQRQLDRAGLLVVGPDGQQVSLAGVCRPVALPSPDPGDDRVRVFPRLVGRTAVQALAGPQAVWRESEACLMVPVAAATSDWCDLGYLDPAISRPAPGSGPQPGQVNGASGRSRLACLAYDGTLDGLKTVSVVDLASVSGRTAAAMLAVGISNVHDLLHHIPHRYVDLSQPVSVTDTEPGRAAAVIGTVSMVTPPGRPGGILRATVRDSHKTALSVRWFNPSWTVRRLTPGARVVICGKVEAFTTASGYTGRSMTNPLTETLTAGQQCGLVGVYPASGKHELTTWQVRAGAVEAAARLGRIGDPIPARVLAAHALVDRATALRQVHDPTSGGQARAARDRLAYDELLRLQLALWCARAAHDKHAGIAHTPPGGTADDPGGWGRLLGRFVSGLPFHMTPAQRAAVEQVVADMRSARPMHRLLQGDVGSGKTVVCAAAMVTAVQAGHQAALLAPTSLLAEQHHGEMRARLAGLTRPDGRSVTTALLTHRVTGTARAAVLEGLADGGVDVVVGTHVLLAGQVRFRSLSLAVVDEQHRFGVAQRAALRRKGSGGRLPHMLYATATPIPRTALMSVFGDLDLSVLDELPPGRVPVTTHLVEGTDGDPSIVGAAPWVAVRDQVSLGRQAFVVCPLVAASATAQAAAAAATRDTLTGGALRGLRVGLVTGRQRPHDRAAVMAEFAAGHVDVLVATTVVEVGVNVPNASIMVVLGADRFGIAQLHQLRGRVGRGRHPGCCYLVATPRTTAGLARLQTVRDCTDGFALAEADLRARGAGHLAGQAQSGRGHLQIADVLTDTQLLEWARGDAQAIVAGDPHLRGLPALRAEVTASLDPEAVRWLSTA